MQFKIIPTLVASYLCIVQGRDDGRIVFPNGINDLDPRDPEQSCRTPTNSPGTCISLYDCNPLLALVSKPNKSQQDINTLQRSKCGFQGQIPKVCCPQTQPTPPPPSNGCFTPDGQDGTCIGLYSCPHLAALLRPPVPNDVITFVQNSRCDGPDQYSVCCGATAPVFGNQGGSPARGCSSTVALPDPNSGCCGVESLTGDRITGGNDTNIDQYPWMTLIEYRSKRNNQIRLLCGGALISGKYVITAAHCVSGAVLDVGTPANVRLGEYDTSNDPRSKDCIIVPGGGEDCTIGATIIPIERTIPHEEYNAFNTPGRHDIALIRLARLAPYNDFIKPICLPLTDVTATNPPDLVFWVAGWGAVNETHSKSLIKQQVDVPYRTKEECQPAYNVPRRKADLWEKQLCAGGEAGKDSCKGDSGGPLMYENGRRFELIGIVSFGPTPCGAEDIPGVYTKVYEYNSWIRKNIKP